MKDIYDKSIEEFDERYGQGLDKETKRGLYLYNEHLGFTDIHQEIKTFLKHHALALIDAEIERVEGMKKPIRHFTNNHEGRLYEVDPVGRHKCTENCRPDYDELGYNQALTDHLTHLKEQRESISKEQE